MSHSLEISPRMLDTKAAAEYLDLSPNTLNRWRWSGDGPIFIKLGNAVRYRIADLDAFIARGVREHTSAKAGGASA